MPVSENGEKPTRESGINLGFWTLHPADEPPGSMFRENSGMDWAGMPAKEIGRSRRICAKCEAWCWVPAGDRDRVLAELFRLGWAFEGKEWMCPNCVNQADRMSIERMKEQAGTRPAYLYPVATFEGGSDESLRGKK